MMINEAHKINNKDNVKLINGIIIIVESTLFVLNNIIRVFESDNLLS